MMVSNLLWICLLVGYASCAVFKVPIKRVNRGAIGSRWNRVEHGESELAEPLYDHTKEFIGDVHFGTPPQHFQLVFDTGSANTWITDNQCECDCKNKLSCKLFCEKHCCESSEEDTSRFFFPNHQEAPDQKICKKKSKFDRKASVTYRRDGRDFTIEYPRGKVSGKLGIDVLSLDGGLSIPNVTFGQADTMDKSFMDDPLDGVFGLAFQLIAVDNVVPPINQAINNHLLDDPIFTVWLKHNTVPGAESGAITFGDIDGDHCGFIMAYERLTEEKLWQFKVSEITIQGETIKTGWTASSNTGNGMIKLQKPLFDKVVTASGATWDNRNKFWKVNCNAQFNVSFKIGELDLPVKSDKLIHDLGGKNGCQLLVAEATDPNIQVVLGNPFNQEYCVIYDYSGQLGFAESY